MKQYWYIIVNWSQNFSQIALLFKILCFFTVPAPHLCTIVHLTVMSFLDSLGSDSLSDLERVIQDWNSHHGKCLTNIESYRILYFCSDALHVGHITISKLWMCCYWFNNGYWDRRIKINDWERNKSVNKNIKNKEYINIK